MDVARRQPDLGNGYKLDWKAVRTLPLNTPNGYASNWTSWKCGMRLKLRLAVANWPLVRWSKTLDAVESDERVVKLALLASL